ncbi:MAG TPA: response regulator, partial [Thermoplasmata archaeon]|nr:response regulator [Thermoplasmata archaeon]
MGGAPIHVLVVEDQPADAKLVEIALASEPAGAYPLRRATTIAEALRALALDAVDVVLTDLGLPDSAGVDGVVRLKRARPELPVVVLSGADDPERQRDALAAGA